MVAARISRIRSLLGLHSPPASSSQNAAAVALETDFMFFFSRSPFRFHSAAGKWRRPAVGSNLSILYGHLQVSGGGGGRVGGGQCNANDSRPVWTGGETLKSPLFSAFLILCRTNANSFPHPPRGYKHTAGPPPLLIIFLLLLVHVAS